MKNANKKAILLVYRGDADGQIQKYEVKISDGMVVLDALLQIQAKNAPDLAFRYNCKGGRCGSCTAEINGKPALMCKTRLSDLPIDESIVVKPMKGFPVIKDLVTDMSRLFKDKKPKLGSDIVL